MSFNLENLGGWSREFEFEVETDRVKAYAEATNDDIPEHATGELAPPNFAVVPLFETPVTREAAGGVVDLTPEEALRVLHGEQDLFIHQPIRPGMILRVKGATVGVHGKPSGTTVVSRIETTEENGAPVNTQYMTAFYRNVATEAGGGEEAPDHRTPPDLLGGEPVATVEQRFDADQTFRYAEASGDHMPVHLDEAVAKSVGLPGIIVHGLCTMAFATHAVIHAVADGDPRRLKRFAVRFSRIALPEQEIATRIWNAGEREGDELYAFMTLDPEGEPVLTNGLAQVR